LLQLKVETRFTEQSRLQSQAVFNRSLSRAALCSVPSTSDACADLAQSIPSVTLWVLNAFNEFRAACSSKRFLTARYRERLLCSFGMLCSKPNRTSDGASAVRCARATGYLRSRPEIYRKLTAHSEHGFG
jgi:hypothetical protein